MMDGHSRRDVLRMAGAVAVVPVTAAPLVAQANLFFTPKEFRMVEELAEIIIPADDHSPGARAAGVAQVIDKDLAEAFDETPRNEWREGLEVVDTICHKMHKVPFLEATPEQRVEVVSRMARHEDHPKKPEELFFHRLKGRTAHGYYTSKIGIHQEIEYQGNSILEEFVGFDADLVKIQLSK